jgi:hypothetical protein
MLESVSLFLSILPGCRCDIQEGLRPHLAVPQSLGCHPLASMQAGNVRTRITVQRRTRGYGTMIDEVGNPPEKGKVSKLVEPAVEAALSVVPVAGGPLAVLWKQFAGAAYEKRRQAWSEEVSSAINDLLLRVHDLDAQLLGNNDRFLDALAYATATAVTTGQQEKIDALRNAVLNSALPSSISADRQAIFLHYIRDFTASHLKLLKLLADPPAWFEASDRDWPNLYAGGLGSIIEAGIPEFIGQRDLYDQLGSDLAAAGMTNTGGFHTTMTASGLTAGRLTETGKAFLSFITEPCDRLK